MAHQNIGAGKRMSRGVVHNGVLYISGQVAQNRQASLAIQTSEVLAKLDAIAAEAGATKSDMLSIMVYLPNIKDFDAMNLVYDAWIDPDAPPARACVEARLADPDLRVEMSAIVAVPDK